MTFTLKIELGNDAMQSSGDVAQSLAKVAQTLRAVGSFEDFAEESIRDTNGNTVGSWKVK